MRLASQSNNLSRPPSNQHVQRKASAHLVPHSGQWLLKILLVWCYIATDRFSDCCKQKEAAVHGKITQINWQQSLARARPIFCVLFLQGKSLSMVWNALPTASSPSVRWHLTTDETLYHLQLCCDTYLCARSFTRARNTVCWLYMLTSRVLSGTEPLASVDHRWSTL